MPERQQHLLDRAHLVPLGRDLEDAPRRRVGPRLSELEDFAQAIGRIDVVEAIEAVRHLPRPKKPNVLAVVGTVSIGSFPNGRSWSTYLKVQTDRGPGIMAIPRPEDQTTTCWLGGSIHFEPFFSVRLTTELRQMVDATLAAASGTEL